MTRTPHAHRLRTGRFSESGRVYLITSATEDRRPFFSDFHLGRLVVDQFKRADESGIATSLAWVVMPDHFHWLLELSTGSLERLVKQVKASSAVALNRAMRRRGHVWQRGFYDRALRYDEDHKAAARYIVLNPVRAGLVTRVGDYPLWDCVWVGDSDAG
ncbi:transposase [Pseudomonas sp. RC10]|uniref:REP-associated tyrosine transposase n=1 Tax=Pseudomonas bambusae TaxID=3139142 RepID=UPI00313A128B